MNKRIQTLMEQAVISVDIVTGNESLDDELLKMYIPNCFAEKFAELILKECAGIYDKVNNGNVHEGTYDYLEALHRHFGVE